MVMEALSGFRRAGTWGDGRIDSVRLHAAEAEAILAIAVESRGLNAGRFQ
jgi:hypothetical protein